MSRQFEVAFTWEIAENVSIALRVTGTQQPFTPARLIGHPDDWAPAEGGELEDLKIISGARLPEETERRLLDDDNFRDKIEQMLMEEREDAKAEA